MVKVPSNNIKNYLQFTHQVLGVSRIYPPSVKTLVSNVDAENRKEFNFYFWPNVTATTFNKQTLEAHTIRTIFVFFTTQNHFENQLKTQVEMISKMNGVLGGVDGDLMVAWVTPNAEVDFFSVVAQWELPLQLILFRTDVSVRETVYTSGVHTILETLSPLDNPNDLNRKRLVWNDFKRLLAFTETQTRPT